MLMTDLCLIQRRGWERRGEERRGERIHSPLHLFCLFTHSKIVWPGRLGFTLLSGCSSLCVIHYASDKVTIAKSTMPKQKDGQGRRKILKQDQLCSAGGKSGHILSLQSKERQTVWQLVQEPEGPLPEDVRL